MAGCVGPGIIRWGRWSVPDGTSVGGERARRLWLVASAPELSVGVDGACRTGLPSGARERVGRGWLRRPRNYPSGSMERVGRDWLRWPRYYPSGAKSASDGDGSVVPGIIRRGIGFCG